MNGYSWADKQIAKQQQLQAQVNRLTRELAEARARFERVIGDCDACDNSGEAKVGSTLINCPNCARGDR